MADYNSSLPVRTETDGDVVSKIVGKASGEVAEVNTADELLVHDANVITELEAVNTELDTISGDTATTATNTTDTLAGQTDGTQKTQITDGTTVAGVTANFELKVHDDNVQTELSNINGAQTDGSQLTRITDGTNTASVSTSNELLVNDSACEAILQNINTSLGDGSVATQLWDGTDSLAINTDGSINVQVAEGIAGAEVHVYDTVASAVPATPETVVDYTVTTGKTLQLKSVQVASSAKAKFEVKAGTPSSETTRAVGFISTAKGMEQVFFSQPIEVVAGDKVLVIVTNLDKANADVYAFVNGNEI
jgi:hypothetical protein